MKIFTVAGDFECKDDAVSWATGFVFAECEAVEQPKPANCTRVDLVQGNIEVWYDYAGDYYFYVEAEQADTVEDETIKVFFYGVDSWNRPVFRAVDRKWFYGSTHRLLDFDTEEREALDRVQVGDLEWFGSRFDCEPSGGRPVRPLEIITLEEANK